MKPYLGALVYDVPRMARIAFYFDSQRDKLPWVHMRNRDQSLIPAPDGPGVKCDWQWTSDLYLPKVFPAFGGWLYRRAFKDFPVSFLKRPASIMLNDPQVSFVIGHRGSQRLPLLLTTLQSIAAQEGCRFECIVVEQDDKRLIEKHLPDWVHYIHTSLPEKDMAYSRARAFNAGARAAQGELLIFHDNDMVIPAVYGRELYRFFCQGFEVVNLKRFIFYLDRKSSKKKCQESDVDFSPKIEAIVQNLEAGGSVGISRTAFFEIGGFDERFIGWGGEDNEFCERAQTRKVYPYGYLPLVHLWHPPQVEKFNQHESSGSQLYHKLSVVDVNKRISMLKNRLDDCYNFNDTK